MNTLEQSITDHPFTKGLNPHYIHLLTRCATYERYGPRQELFREGFPADRLFLIHSGQVSLQTFIPERGVVTIDTLIAGDIVGWSWMFPPYRSEFTAVTTEPTEATALSTATLRDEMDENHDFGYAVFGRVCESMVRRLHECHRRIAEFLGTPD